MQFCNHSTFFSRNQLSGRKETPEQFYARHNEYFIREDNTKYALRGIAESMYYRSNRPYYLIYPCILDLVDRIPDKTPISAIHLPGVPVVNVGTGTLVEIQSGLDRGLNPGSNPWKKALSEAKPDDLYAQVIALRFPVGSRYDSILAAFSTIQGDKQTVGLHCNRRDPGGTSLVLHDSCVRIGPGDDDDDGTLGYLLKCCKEEAPGDEKSWELELRLLACLGLLVDSGLDFLKRDLLSRDAGKEPTEEITRRATAAKGLGWSLGKALDAIPHTRRPHFAIRHMGSGSSKKPTLRPIKGSIVKGRKLTQVPTGMEDVPCSVESV